MAMYPLPNGSRPAPGFQFLRNVRRLPDAHLAERFEQCTPRQHLKPMLSTLQTVVHFQLADQLRFLNLRGTFLFHGPPGTGKSTWAQLLPQLWAATTGGVGTLAEVDAHGIASREHGQSQKNVAALFAEMTRLPAREPHFLIIDELETIATDREEISGKTSPIDARNSVNALLEHIERKPPNCIFLATTNRLQLVDAAVRSRFDFCFAVPLPTTATLMAALQQKVAAINPQSTLLRPLAESSLRQFNTLLDGYSLRDVEKLVVWCAALHGGDMSFSVSQMLSTLKYLRKSSTSLNGDAA